MDSFQHKRFVLGFLAVFVVTAGVVGAFNFLVNPYWLFPAPILGGFNVVKPKAAERSQVIKPYQVLQSAPRTLIGGNSRPEMGIDPQSACFEDAPKPIFNLGIPGAGVYMQGRVLQHVIASGGVKKLLMAVDFLDFLVDRQGPESFRDWPPRPEGFDPRLLVDRHGEENPAYFIHLGSNYLTGLFSLNGFFDSLLTLSAQGRPNASTIRADGFNPARDYIDIIESEGQEVLFSQKISSVLTKLSDRRTALLHDGTQWSTSFESLRRLLRIARAENIDVTLFINAYHLDYLKAIAASERWYEFEEWKRMLVKLAEQEGGIPLWDFSMVNDFTTEIPPPPGRLGNPLRWFWEPAHYRAETGEIMLAHMFGKPCNAHYPGAVIGARITSDNIHQHLMGIRTAFRSIEGDRSEDREVAGRSVSPVAGSSAELP